MALKTSNTGRFNQIMNSRMPVGMADADEVVKLMITSATLSFYDEANDLVKDIYNFNARKENIVQSPWFKEQYDAAIALETAGKTEEAREIFDDLLNKTTLTASIINNDGMQPQFDKGAIVMVPIVKVESKDGRVGIGTGRIYAIKAKTLTKGSGFQFTTEIEVPATVKGSAVTA